MKIQNKIIYLLLLIFLSYTLIFSGFIYYSISNYAFTDFYKRLEIRAITTAKYRVENENHTNVIRELRYEYLEQLPNEKIDLVKLSDLHDFHLDTALSGYESHFIEEIVKDSIAHYNNNKRFYYGTIYENTDHIKYLVIASAENYFITHHIIYLRNLLITSLIIAFVIIFFISISFSKRIIKPITDIINKVKDISLQSLHLRLEPAGNDGDTISDLTNTFNDMLNRLETSFETQKNFISNASHELNTPLTAIIGRTEVTLSLERTNEEYVQALKTVLCEAEKLERKTNALLYLARTGYNGKIQKESLVRIDQLLMEVKKTAEEMDANNKIIFDFSLLPENPTLLNTQANEQLLHLALSNIVLNGCKYSTDHTVYVAVGVADQRISVIISDHGIGIPEEELQFIYDPYFRASNTGYHEGYGIGLPLARNIIKMHQGDLEVRSELGEGTTVYVQLIIADE
ncbi:sensor histidine kinase [Fulvivirga ligni]|uniref:sensor histidine kinase n=1 Tax=Fulvivirga ligni TaxID=2904246 RepID=UPI001F1C90E2|nr:HAMP domain-containing sensor histidine kinase [Fulvivirga ligni]UII20149.1 HAMP domain-containing histidine kinase [Fulvivirga ligni]